MLFSFKAHLYFGAGGAFPDTGNHFSAISMRLITAAQAPKKFIPHELKAGALLLHTAQRVASVGKHLCSVNPTESFALFERSVRGAPRENKLQYKLSPYAFRQFSSLLIVNGN